MDEEKPLRDPIVVYFNKIYKYLTPSIHHHSKVCKAKVLSYNSMHKLQKTILNN